MTTVEVLKKAKALLEERDWTQGAFARNLIGYEVVSGSSDARSYCAIGAVDAAEGTSVTDAIEYLRRCVELPIDRWNDAPGRTKEEVLAAFDRAIELAEKAQ